MTQQCPLFHSFHPKVALGGNLQNDGIARVLTLPDAKAKKAKAPSGQTLSFH
jgi:hypothetical protein